MGEDDAASADPDRNSRLNHDMPLSYSHLRRTTNQPRRLESAIIRHRTIQNAFGLSRSGVPGTFIWKMAAMRESGKTMKVTTVSVFITSFWDVERSESFVSRS